MYASFVSSKFFDLTNVSASKKFVFADCSVLDRLCHLFCILSFTSVGWNSFFFLVEELHVTSVAVANV